MPINLNNISQRSNLIRYLLNTRPEFNKAKNNNYYYGQKGSSSYRDMDIKIIDNGQKGIFDKKDIIYINNVKMSFNRKQIEEINDKYNKTESFSTAMVINNSSFSEYEIDNAIAILKRSTNIKKQKQLEKAAIDMLINNALVKQAVRQLKIDPYKIIKQETEEEINSAELAENNKTYSFKIAHNDKLSEYFERRTKIYERPTDAIFYKKLADIKYEKSFFSAEATISFSGIISAEEREALIALVDPRDRQKLESCFEFSSKFEEHLQKKYGLSFEKWINYYAFTKAGLKNLTSFGVIPVPTEYDDGFQADENPAYAREIERFYNKNYNLFEKEYSYRTISIPYKNLTLYEQSELENKIEVFCNRVEKNIKAARKHGKYYKNRLIADMQKEDKDTAEVIWKMAKQGARIAVQNDVNRRCYKILVFYGAKPTSLEYNKLKIKKIFYENKVAAAIDRWFLQKKEKMYLEVNDPTLKHVEDSYNREKLKVSIDPAYF